MCDLHSKFEEDRTKAAVAIVEDMRVSDRQTDRQTNTQVIIICPMSCIALDRQGARVKQHKSGKRQLVSKNWDGRPQTYIPTPLCASLHAIRVSHYSSRVLAKHINAYQNT